MVLKWSYKSLKCLFRTIMFPLWCNDDDDEWSVWLSCVLCLLWFLNCRVLKGVQKVTKTVLQCALCSFPLLNGLERSPFTECDVWVYRGLERNLKFTVYESVLKELISLKEVSHGEIKTLFKVMQGSWNESRIHCVKWSWKNKFCWR